jgi:hypothetical protein
MISQVNLSYSTTGGTDPWYPIANGVGALSGNKSWTVPDAIGGSLRVKVEDASNPEFVYDISENNFTIAGKINIVNPQENEDWRVNDVRQINWTRSGTWNLVNITYSTNDFGSYWDINTTANQSSLCSGINCTYNWTVYDRISNTAKIRIRDANVSRQNATMDNSSNFYIRGNLTITAPAAIDTWLADSKPTGVPVKWKIDGSIANIRIRLFDNTSWWVLNASYPTTFTNFSDWIVDDSAVNATKGGFIEIADVSDPNNVVTTSSAPFRIRGTLALTYPVGGENHTVYNRTNITWTETGDYPDDTVKIEYNVNNGPYNVVTGPPPQNLSGAAVAASAGKFEWSVPDNLSTNVKIMLTRNRDSAVPSVESGPFSIMGNISVSSPGGGTRWGVNDSANPCPIKWDRIGSIANVTIKYSTNGQTYYTLADRYDASPGIYNWTINATYGIISPTATVQVLDSNDSRIYDISDNFSIVPRFEVKKPSSLQKVNASRQTSIEWDAVGYIEYVNLYYTLHFPGGSSRTALIKNNASTMGGSYAWDVPDELFDNVTVRVTYPLDEGAFDDSDRFKIVPQYVVLAPNGTTYDKWPVLQTRQIKWVCSSANASKVKIYYCLDGGLDYGVPYDSDVDNGYPPYQANDTRYYNFSVPDPGYTCHKFRVKIQDANDSRLDVYVESPNSTITGYLNVTYPNGGQRLVVNQSSSINWSMAGAFVTNVTIDISKDNFQTYERVIYSTPNDESFDWTVPDMINSTLKVRVADKDYYPYANDTSDNYFTIVGAFNITFPVNGSRLAIQQPSTIYWNTTGNIPKVKVIAYSTITDNPRFNYTIDRPYNISINLTNNDSCDWTVPGNATNYTRIRVSDYNDSTVYNESSGNFSMIGSFTITYPNGGENLTVNDTCNINWIPTGNVSITQARIIYCFKGDSCLNYPTSNNSWWHNISEQWNTPNDGIVDNNGTFAWVVPDNITSGMDVYLRIEDPVDPSVNVTSATGNKIRGNFSINSPIANDRWVTYESHAISWNTTGKIGKVKILYSRDNFTGGIYSINDSTPNTENYIWDVVDPRPVFNINASALPVKVRIRVQDYNDSNVSADSQEFNLDFYNITWYVRDFLSNLPIAGGLTVSDPGINWSQSGIASPIMHKTPFGSWAAAWSHEAYGNATKAYAADSDKDVTVHLESKIVHVWEARTDYVYTPRPNVTEDDALAFSSYLVRDGSIAGFRNETTGEFYTIATNCTIEMYNPAGSLITTMNTSDITSAGFFSLEWAPTNLTANVTYPSITQIETNLGGKFRTPFMVNIIPTVSLYNVTKLVTERIDVPLSVFQENVTKILLNQTEVISGKMNQTVEVIQNASSTMINMTNATLASFENRTTVAIASLSSAANQTLNASQRATAAADFLAATAKKYSWRASVSPDPALTGDDITLSAQGLNSTQPLATIYSWDNKEIVVEQPITEVNPGLYQYTFTADGRFTPGKSYTYMVKEQVVTGGLVAGSGMVESMSITTIAGLASAAPEAERAAKKALDAIKAVEAVLISGGDNINIALTLKNLRDSVQALPEVLAKEGPTPQLAKSINEIADKLKVLLGEEGYDFKDLLEKALGESPAIKEVRKKTDAINFVVDLLLQIFEAKFGGIDSPIVSTSVQAGSIIFRVVAVNPSKTKAQKAQVKTYLPQEIRPKDIVELGRLQLEYDAEKSIYYVYKPDVELAPGEVQVFEIEVNDIWVVPPERLDDFKKRVESILTRLENTQYYTGAKAIADTVYSRLAEIAKTQVDETVSRAQHIGIYRDNLITIDQIKEDIAKLEKILATAGGPLAPEMLAKTKIKSEEPSKTMTWIVIFIIIIFVGFLAAVLFFTWQRQARITRDELLAAKKSAFPGPTEEKEPKETP